MAKGDWLLYSVIAKEMAHNFSDGERNEFKAAFDYFDKDGNGSISAKELGQVMKNIGQHITQAELEQMI